MTLRCIDSTRILAIDPRQLEWLQRGESSRSLIEKQPFEFAHRRAAGFRAIADRHAPAGE